MNSMYKTLAAIGLTGLIAASGVLAESTNQPGEVRRAMPGGDGPRTALRPGGQIMMLEMAVARLVRDDKAATEAGLSEDQVKALKDSFDQLRGKRKELQQQISDLETQSAKLMEAATIDEAAALAAVEKVSQLRLELAKLSVRHLVLIKKTLTPEQTAKIKEMAAQHFKDNGERGPLGRNNPPMNPKAPPAK